MVIFIKYVLYLMLNDAKTSNIKISHKTKITITKNSYYKFELKIT